MAKPSDKPAPGTPGGDQDVAGLSDLIHDELDNKPKADPGPALPDDMPAFVPPRPEPAPPPPGEPPPELTVTFWQRLAPKSRKSPVLVIVVIVLVLVLAGVGGAAAMGFLPIPQRLRTMLGLTTTAPKEQPANTTPAAATPPATATPPAAATPAAATPPATAIPPAAATTPAAATPPAATSPSTASPTKTTKTKARSHPSKRKSGVRRDADETAGGQPLTASTIKLGVKQNMSGVKRCIQAARRSGVLTPGKHILLLDWNIAPSGAVTEAHVRGPANVLNTTLDTCFTHAMRRWKFPASPKGAPVRNFPFGPFTLK